MARRTHALSAVLALGFAQYADAFKSGFSGRLPLLPRSPPRVILSQSYLDSLSSNTNPTPDKGPPAPSAENPPSNKGDIIDDIQAAADAVASVNADLQADIQAAADAVASVNAELQAVEDTIVAVREPSLEERISASVASTAASTLTSDTYVAAREKIRDSKSRTQRRLDISRAEREKAEGQIRRMRARAEDKAKKAEDELQVKLDEMQEKIGIEVERITDVLAAEIDVEDQRQGEISDLISSLRSAIDLKEAEVASEDAITAEMIESRSKLKPGPIASQLENLLSQKNEITSIERKLIDDLGECMLEMEAVFADAQSRSAKMEQVLARIKCPEVASEGYEWSDIDDMEEVLEQAAANAVASDARVRELCDRFSQALRNKSAVAERAERTKAMSFKPFLDEVTTQSAEQYGSLKDKDGAEVVGVLAKSLGKAAFDGSKAAIFGLMALADAVCGESVSGAASEAVEKSGALTKSLSGITDSDDIGSLAKTDRVRGAVKSTGDALGAVGKTGKEIARNLSSAKSAEQARDALKDTSKDVVSVASALAALSSKSFNNMKSRKEEAKEREGGSQ